MCNRLTKLSVTMWYTFFGKLHDTSLWILHEMHDASLCDAPDDINVNKSESYNFCVEYYDPAKNQELIKVNIGYIVLRRHESSSLTVALDIAIGMRCVMHRVTNMANRYVGCVLRWIKTRISRLVNPPLWPTNTPSMYWWMLSGYRLRRDIN